MSIDLMPGFGAFTPAASGGLLDGSESDGTQLFSGNAAMTSDWSTAESTLTANAVLAPNGATDAASHIENGANNRHIVYQQRISVTTADATLRVSIYAKATGRRYLAVFCNAANGTSGDAYAYFDLNTGTVTGSGVTGGAQSVANTSMTAAVNSFYKCTGDYRLSATTDNIYFIFCLSDVGTYGAPLTDGNPSYAGDSTSGHYLWRPKLVQL